MPALTYNFDFLNERWQELVDVEFGSGIDSAEIILSSDLELRFFTKDETAPGSRAHKLIQFQGPVELRMSLGPLPPRAVEVAPTLESITATNDFIDILIKPGTKLSGLYVVEMSKRLSAGPPSTWGDWQLISDEIFGESNPSNSTPFRIDNTNDDNLPLVGGDTYRVRANRAGGAWSNTLEATYSAQSKRAPVLVTTGATATTISLRLSGGTPVGGGAWRILYKKLHAADWTVEQTTNTDSTFNHDLTGLTANTEYRIIGQKGELPLSDTRSNYTSFLDVLTESA